MLAQVTIDERHVGLHRTFLAPPGRKAAVVPAKTMLGACKGGAVALSDGPGPLGVAEGIETGLSVLDRLASRSPRVLAR